MYTFIGMIGIILGMIAVGIGWNTVPKSGSKIFSGILMMLGGTISGCFGNPAKDMPNGDPETAGLGIFMFIVGFGVFIYSFYSDKKKIENILEEKRQRQIKQSLIEKEERKNRAEMNIFNKCLENNVMNFDSKENCDALLLIASSYGIEDLEEAKKSFYNGKLKREEELKEKKLKNEEEKINKSRNSDKKIGDEDLKIANYKGKEKYTYSLKKDLEYGRKALELSGQAEKIGLSNMTAKAQKSDWVVWAGMANGIAGPGAAIATAYDIEKKNREAEKNIESVRESGRKLYSEAKNIQNNLPAALKAEEEMIQYIEDRLFDDKKQDDKLTMLNISNITYEINDGYNFNVEFTYNVSDNIKLINSKAILDGSLLIKVLDSEDELVATGYYNADGIRKFDLSYSGADKFDLNSTGFKGKKKVSCKCISSNYKEVDKDIEYKVIIEPNYLWFIEV